MYFNITTLEVADILCKHLNNDQKLPDDFPKSETSMELFRGFASDMNFQVGDIINLEYIGNHWSYDPTIASDFARGPSSMEEKHLVVVQISNKIRGISIRDVFNDCYDKLTKVFPMDYEDPIFQEFLSNENLVLNEDEVVVTNDYNIIVTDIEYIDDIQVVLAEAYTNQELEMNTEVVA